MPNILRITNTYALTSPDVDDHTPYLAGATHRYFYFAAYRVLEDGTWEEGRSWAGTISVRKLFTLMHDAGLLREVTSTKQSGGNAHERQA